MKYKFLTLLLIVILTFISLMLGYFLFFKQPKNNLPLNQNIKQNTNFNTNENYITTDWKIFSYSNSRLGFEFKYPKEWRATSNNATGTDYIVMARVINPDRAGIPETDAPIENFLIRNLRDASCEGQPIKISDKIGTDSGWNLGFGQIYYRGLCFKESGWPITITLSAYDESSQVILDTILSTFQFTY